MLFAIMIRIKLRCMFYIVELLWASKTLLKLLVRKNEIKKNLPPKNLIYVYFSLLILVDIYQHWTGYDHWNVKICQYKIQQGISDKKLFMIYKFFVRLKILGTVTVPKYEIDQSYKSRLCLCNLLLYWPRQKRKSIFFVKSNTSCFLSHRPMITTVYVIFILEYPIV